MTFRNDRECDVSTGAPYICRYTVLFAYLGTTNLMFCFTVIEFIKILVIFISDIILKILRSVKITMYLVQIS